MSICKGSQQHWDWKDSTCAIRCVQMKDLAFAVLAWARRRDHREVRGQRTLHDELLMLAWSCKQPMSTSCSKNILMSK